MGWPIPILTADQPGKARIKTGGGHGGHNGIKSLDAHCGKDYRRLRLGIGPPGHKDRVQGHVLGDFAKRDRDLTIRSLRESGRTPAEGFAMIDGWSCAVPAKA